MSIALRSWRLACKAALGISAGFQSLCHLNVESWGCLWQHVWCEDILMAQYQPQFTVWFDQTPAWSAAVSTSYPRIVNSLWSASNILYVWKMRTTHILWKSKESKYPAEGLRWTVNIADYVWRHFIAWNPANRMRYILFWTRGSII